MQPTRRPSRARSTLQLSERLLARLAQPLVRFLRVEAAGGIVLVGATAAALVWSNSPWRASYTSLWSNEIRIAVGAYEFRQDLAHIVNELLMSVFFFVAGMEIKRELVRGELRDRRSLALPAMAAVGGMAVPALIYSAFNAGGDGAAGWGIPMATDIAFALGVAALLGDRIPAAVKILLLTLAVVDDIGAIVVIAFFYTDDLDVRPLMVALAIVALIAVLQRARKFSVPVLVVMGVALWLAVFESGVHATIAGVVLGLLIPAGPPPGRASSCDRLIDVLHPWTSYVIVPVFALANAGVVLSLAAVSEPTAVLAGVAVALVVGKLFGVASFAWLAVRLGWGRLPEDATWGHLIGVAALAGIGFTVSLFVTGLAFESADLQAEAKIGVIIASLVAAITGAAVLVLTARRTARHGR